MRAYPVRSSTVLSDGTQQAIHDLSQLLLTSMYHLQGLLKTNLKSDQKNQAEDLEESLHRAVSLLRELRDKTNPFSANRQCSINAVIERVARAFARQLEEKEIEVELQLCRDLPLVCGDSGQFERVFANLVLNAIQALEPQKERRSLQLKTDFERTRRLIRVTVADSGPGIPVEILPRIFEPFFTTKAQGTGLGLAICRAIVFDHKGWIEAANRLSGGASFEIYLSVPTNSLIW